MSMNTAQLQKRVMRRIYYAYLLSFLSQPMFWQGIVLGASTMLLARWLHVASIFNNILATQVGSVPQYMYGSVTTALAGGEVMTVVTLVLAGMVAVSAGFRLMNTLSHKTQYLVRH
jgi:hypothetical protein